MSNMSMTFEQIVLASAHLQNYEFAYKNTTVFHAFHMIVDSIAVLNTTLLSTINVE